jgi:hypothetical protein
MRPIQAGFVLLAGGAVAVRSAIGLQDPDYWNPVTPLDYAAVWWHSAALLGSAGVAWLVAWLARPDRRSAVAAALGGASLVVAAAANALEDALGMKGLGSVYVFGNVVGGFAMIGLTVALIALHARTLALVALAAFFGPFLHASAAGFVVPVIYVWFVIVLFRRPEALAPGRHRDEAAPAG